MFDSCENVRVKTGLGGKPEFDLQVSLLTDGESRSNIFLLSLVSEAPEPFFLILFEHLHVRGKHNHTCLCT